MIPIISGSGPGLRFVSHIHGTAHVAGHPSVLSFFHQVGSTTVLGLRGVLECSGPPSVTGIGDIGGLGEVDWDGLGRFPPTLTPSPGFGRSQSNRDDALGCFWGLANPPRPEYAMMFEELDWDCFRQELRLGLLNGGLFCTTSRVHSDSLNRLV